MSRPKWDVMWCPFHSDRFITWDNDAVLSLYEIGPRDNSVRDSDHICKFATKDLYNDIPLFLVENNLTNSFQYRFTNFGALHC